MSLDQISVLQQCMFVAHGSFHDAIAAYRAAQHTHAPAEVLQQASTELQAAGTRLDLAISTLLHHLHGTLRSEEADAIARQAQRFRDQLRVECYQLTDGQG